MKHAGPRRLTGRQVVTALGACLLAFGALVFLWPADEKEEIRSLVTSLAELGSYEAPGHPFEALAEAKELVKLLVPPLTILLTDESEHTREYQFSDQRLIEGFVAFRREFHEFAVTAEPSAIEIEGERAEVTVQAKALGRDQGRSDFFMEQGTVVLTLERRDGEWRVMKAEVHQERR